MHSEPTSTPIPPIHQPSLPSSPTPAPPKITSQDRRQFRHHEPVGRFFFMPRNQPVMPISAAASTSSATPVEAGSTSTVTLEDVSVWAAELEVASGDGAVGQKGRDVVEETGEMQSASDENVESNRFHAILITTAIVGTNQLIGFPVRTFQHLYSNLKLFIHNVIAFGTANQLWDTNNLFKIPFSFNQSPPPSLLPHPAQRYDPARTIILGCCNSDHSTLLHAKPGPSYPSLQGILPEVASATYGPTLRLRTVLSLMFPRPAAIC